MVDKKEVKSASISSVQTNRTVVMHLSTAVWVGIVIVLLGLSFWGGDIYGSGLNSGTNSGGLQSLNSAAYRRYAVGLVVYISPTSITVANDENSLNQTFAITNKTLISINGKKSTANLIQPGNIVLIQEDKGNSSTANVILVNSHFSG